MPTGPSADQVAQERLDLSLAHLPGMAQAVETDQMPDPKDIRLLGSAAVINETDAVAQLIE